ncbi:MAG: 2-oxoacid:acceptor oxidoreductase subunit alpha, partial [Candidatus Odinarchaeota archaeon]
LGIRVRMVNKRLSKLKIIEKEAIPPELYGGEAYKYLIIGWGSTFNTIREALKKLNREDLSLLFFKQVYPIHHSTVNYLEKAEKIIIIENNATCQFGKLIHSSTGFKATDCILSYNGLPFTVEEIIDKIEKILGK